MRKLQVSKADKFQITIDDIAPDKSISHRCAVFSLLSNKMSRVSNYLQAEDTINTLKIVKSLGAKIEKKGNTLFIAPPIVINEPKYILECGNSGTAIRILMGLLSGIDGFFILNGDKYLSARPMERVAGPLRSIGAKIDGRQNSEFAPISIRGGKLKAFDYESKISSSQVKTAMILAALNADKVCTYSEPELSRDHSERMLKVMGAKILRSRDKIVIYPREKPFEPLNIDIPNDPSSAFFFAVAAAIIPNSRVTLKNMLLNNTRIEAYKVLSKMGAKVEYVERENTYESIGDIIVEYAPLSGVEVSEHIPWLIDELPALSIAFACAQGKSSVKNASELRVKESDRISVVANNLRACGIEVSESKDGYEVVGGTLKSATVNSFGDHRIAMSFAIAGLVCGITVEDIDCIQTSFPNFTQILKRITQIS